MNIRIYKKYIYLGVFKQIIELNINKYTFKIEIKNK